MNLILKKFIENLINIHKIAPKTANIRAKKIGKILENNCVIEHFKNLDDLSIKITPKIKEIIIEEIDEISREKNLDNKDIQYISIYSDEKHIIDIIIEDKNYSFLLSFEIYARKENIAIEIFKISKKENIFSENSSLTILNDKQEKIIRKYFIFEKSCTAFDIIKNKTEILLKNIISENKIILNENEYEKLYLE